MVRVSILFTKRIPKGAYIPLLRRRESPGSARSDDGKFRLVMFACLCVSVFVWLFACTSFKFNILVQVHSWVNGESLVVQDAPQVDYRWLCVKCVYSFRFVRTGVFSLPMVQS